MTNINYPESVTNNYEKAAFLYRVQELLRLEFNNKGKQYREKKISDEDWKSYKKEWDNKHLKIVNAMLEIRSQLQNDDSLEVDLENIFTGK